MPDIVVEPKEFEGTDSAPGGIAYRNKDQNDDLSGRKGGGLKAVRVYDNGTVELVFPKDLFAQNRRRFIRDTDLPCTSDDKSSTIVSTIAFSPIKRMHTANLLGEIFGVLKTDAPKKNGVYIFSLLTTEVASQIVDLVLEREPPHGLGPTPPAALPQRQAVMVLAT